MKADSSETTVGSGRFLQLVRRGDWEFVRRKNATGVVIIAAITDEKNVVFVEQFRAPVNGSVIEFPAGLAGDTPEDAGEPLKNAARRELWEETGYEAKHLHLAYRGASSAGLTDEVATMFVAAGLTKTGEGGGVDEENIVVHEVFIDEAHDWLLEKTQQGCHIDGRVFSGIYFLQRFFHEE